MKRIYKNLIFFLCAFALSFGAVSTLTAQPYPAIESQGNGSYIANPPTLSVDGGLTSIPDEFIYNWSNGANGRTVYNIPSGVLLCVTIEHLVFPLSETHCLTTISNTYVPTRNHSLLPPLGVAIQP